jgi:nicotinate phosphoribosyltransferase
MKYGLKAFGTQAHEWYMAHLSFVDDVRQAQKRAMHVWQQEYDDDLGYVLSDTFTTKAFFMDFDKTLTKSHEGPRHDSGNPYLFGDEVIKHYEMRKVNPLTKSVIFSDGLKISRKVIVPLFLYFVRRIKTSFGVGTNLTNDTDRKALNIVIKMYECQGKPVVKLSDSPGKEMGDPAMVAKVKAAYGLN